MPVAPAYSAPVAGDMPLGWAPPLVPKGDPGTLDLPWYGIGPIDAVKRAYLKTFRYDGRAGLGEYWWYMLYTLLLTILLVSVLGIVITQTTSSGPGSSSGPAALVGTLIGAIVVLHIPVGISLTVRRLHDGGNSGWMYLIGLVPWVGGLIVLIICCALPKPSGARFDHGYHDAWAPPGTYPFA